MCWFVLLTGSMNCGLFSVGLDGKIIVRGDYYKISDILKGNHEKENDQLSVRKLPNLFR